MTTLIAFSSVDSEGVSAIYLASDSRLSWDTTDGGILSWDHGKKVFYSQRSPLIMGYCGDVLFPTQILSQIIDLLDNNLLSLDNLSPIDVFSEISNLIKHSFDNFPKIVITKSFTIIICGRDNASGDFYCYELAWKEVKVEEQDKKEWKWVDKPKDINKIQSDVIAAYGSGGDNFNNFKTLYAKSDFYGKTRGIFNCFYNAIKSQKDSRSGGVPQLVGIYEDKAGKCLGVISEGQRYLNGMHINNNCNYNNIKWVNELFEVCDGDTLERGENQQRHIKPNNIKAYSDVYE
ncbi:hypothetical protein [Neobacillus cucumis]|uniref:hypothetical protein n=1 Tax=Neobacillus cucumis TaxID=1740721 RepID=UPI001964CBE0|nr:hypothetical protein [Neobacillus cucumis]MBM7652995.1 hypothetical protein [Neobacillus cucumis]